MMAEARQRVVLMIVACSPTLPYRIWWVVEIAAASTAFALTGGFLKGQMSLS